MDADAQPSTPQSAVPDVTQEPGAAGAAPAVTSQPLPDTATPQEQFPVAPKADAQPTAEQPPTQPTTAVQGKIAQLQKAGFNSQEISDYTSRTGGKLLAAGFSQQEVNDYMGIKTADMSGVQKMAVTNLTPQQSEDGGDQSQNLMGFPKMIDTAFGMSVSSLLNGAKSDEPLPAQLREHLMGAYAAGTASDAGDFMQQAIPAVVKATTGNNSFSDIVKNEGFAAAVPLWAYRNVVKPIIDNPEEFSQATDNAQKTAIETLKNIDPEAKGNYWSKLLSTPLVSDATSQKANAEIEKNSNGDFWHDLRIRIEAKSPQAMEAMMNSPYGEAFKIIGGVPGANQVFTAVNNYGAPAVAKELGTTTDTVMAIATIFPFIHKGAENIAGGLKEATASRSTTYHPVTPEAIPTPETSPVSERLQPNAPTDQEVTQAVQKAGPAFKDKAPSPHDFNDASFLMFGHEGETGGAATLRDVYAKTGVTPAQAWEDARGNPAIMKDLQAGRIPAAYDNLREPEPEVAPPKGVQYSDLDPNSKAFQTAKEIAQENGVDLQARPKETATPPTLNEKEISLAKELRDTDVTDEEQQKAVNIRKSGGTVLRDVLERVNGGLHLPSYSDAKFLLENGRSDVAQIVAEQAQRYADSLSEEPGVGKDHPKYEEIKNNLLEKKQAAQRVADGIKELVQEHNKTEPNPHAAENAALGLGDDHIPNFSAANDTGVDNGESLAETPILRQATEMAAETQRPVQGEHLDKDFAEHAKNYPNTYGGVREAARDWVVQKARETGNEHGVVINPSTGQATHIIEGAPDELPLDAVEHLLTDPNSQLELHHSHPGSKANPTDGGALSDGDLKVLTFPGILRIVAHDLADKGSSAKYTDPIRTFLNDRRPWVGQKFAEGLYPQAKVGVTQLLRDLIKSNKMPYSGRMYAEVVNRILAKAGVIEYSSDHSIPDLPEINNFIDARAKEVYNYLQDRRIKYEPVSDTYTHSIYTDRENPNIRSEHEGAIEGGAGESGSSVGSGTRPEDIAGSSGTSSESGGPKLQQAKSADELLDIQRSDPAGFADYTAARRAVEQSIKGEKPDMDLKKAYQILEDGRDKFEPVFKEMRRKEYGIDLPPPEPFNPEAVKQKLADILPKSEKLEDSSTLKNALKGAANTGRWWWNNYDMFVDKLTGGDKELNKAFSVTENFRNEKAGLISSVKKLQDAITKARGSDSLAETKRQQFQDLKRNYIKDEATGKPREFINNRGEKVKLKFSKSEARDMLHVLDQKGAYESLTSKESKKGYTDEMLNAVKDTLDAKDIAQVQAQKQFLKEYYNKVAPIYQSLEGKDLPQIPSYYPLVRKGYEVPSSTEGMLDPFKGDFNRDPSFTKQRTDNTFDIPQRSDTNVMLHHIAKVEKYVAFAEKVKGLESVLNDREIARLTNEHLGENFLDYMQDHIKTFTNNGIRDYNPALRALNTAYGNFAFAKLAGKALLGAKHFSLITGFISHVPPGDFITGLGDFLRHPKEAISNLMTSPVMQDRYKNYDSSMENRIIQQQAEQYSTWLGRQLKNPDFLHFMMGLGQMGHQAATMLGGHIYYKYLTEKQGLGHDDALRQVENLTNETQQSGDADKLSMAQKNEYTRVVNMFLSAPAGILRTEQKVVTEFARNVKEDSSAGNVATETAKMAYKMVILHAGTALLFQAFNSAFSSDKQAQKEYEAKMAVGPLDGLPIVGNIINGIAAGLFHTKEAKYGVQMPGLLGGLQNTYQDANNAFTKVHKAFEGDDKDFDKFKTWLEVMSDMSKPAGDVASFAGIPDYFDTNLPQTVHDIQHGNYGEAGLAAAGYPKSVSSPETTKEEKKERPKIRRSKKKVENDEED